MEWIFASVVLVLFVLVPWFRNFILLGVLAVGVFVGIYIYDKQEREQARIQEQLEEPLEQGWERVGRQPTLEATCERIKQEEHRYSMEALENRDKCKQLEQEVQHD